MSVQEMRIEGAIPVNLPIRNHKRFLFISKDQRALTHGLHKYPAKFFPELPRWIIERYSEPGELVLDPFMGSGTTNLEASVAGRDSIGIDVDPFSRLLSKVKTTPLPSKHLLDTHRSICQHLRAYDSEKAEAELPDFPYRDNWFKPHALREMAYLKAGIDGLKVRKEEIRSFYRICLSSIVRAVSEADNNCTRTVIRKKLNKQVNPGDAITLFAKRIEQNISHMLELVKEAPTGDVMIPDHADARSMDGVPDETIDLALTSPPYMNAVDYPRTHQLELYWLGLANGSLQHLKREHVGTEVVTAKEYRTLQKTESSAANTAIKKIFSVDPRRACIASRYINDMAANMREVRRVLKPNRNYVIVVGNNMVRGIAFETWRYLKQIAPPP